MDADTSTTTMSIPDLDAAWPIPAAPVHAAPTDHRALIALCSGTFLASLLFLAPGLFFPQMAGDLQVSVPLLGQVTTVMLLLSALFGLAVGPLSDRSGYRRVILIGLVATAAFLLDFGLAPTFAVLLLASVAGAVADSSVLGPSLALAGTRTVGPSSRRAIGWVNGTAAVSAIVGVPALTAIANAAGWRAAFLAAALGAVAALGLAYRWLPHHHGRATGPLRPDALAAPYRPLLRDRTMRRLYGARALGAVCWYGLLTYLGAFLGHQLGLGTGQVGLVYMIAGTGFFLGSLAGGGPLARIPTHALVVAGYAVMALLMGVAFSARLGSVATIVLITAAALAMGVGMVGLFALFLAATPSSAGTTMTLSGSIFNLGAAVGGAIGGVLLALAGYDALAVGLPLFGLAAAILSWRAADG